MIVETSKVLATNFGLMPLPCTGFVTLLDMVFYLFVTFKVGKARAQFDVPAPRMDGPPEFLSICRVQQNTAEQLVLHLPLLWIAALAMDDVFAAAFGVIWLVGRALYARGYYIKPKRRAKGFFVGLAVNVILFAAGLAGTIVSF